MSQSSVKSITMRYSSVFHVETWSHPLYVDSHWFPSHKITLFSGNLISKPSTLQCKFFPPSSLCQKKTNLKINNNKNVVWKRLNKKTFFSESLFKNVSVTQALELGRWPHLYLREKIVLYSLVPVISICFCTGWFFGFLSLFEVFCSPVPRPPPPPAHLHFWSSAMISQSLLLK